jgi:hypothetical protein
MSQCFINYDCGSGLLLRYLLFLAPQFRDYLRKCENQSWVNVQAVLIVVRCSRVPQVKTTDLERERMWNAIATIL